MAYKKDYQAEINDAVLKGDYNLAQNLERERNEKIDIDNLDYEKTYSYQAPTSFTQSQNSSDRDKQVGNALTNLTNIAGKTDIISDDVRKGMNSTFKTPSAIQEADAYLSSQLKKIQSGRTSYSDDVQAMIDKIMNREKFSYDVDNDQLFQQALASAMNSGKQAMQDTIGQASALTGGYGSTYATSAGNQAYNAFIEDAYNNLPQYYQMAMEAYQMEGDEMYRQFGMLSEMDDKEYSRNVTAFDATSQYRNRMYDEAYSMYRDTKNDAFAMANVQLNEHGQLVNDAYNLYNATSNYADSLYNREYQSWADSINLALEQFGLQNSSAIANRNFNYQQERDAKTDAWNETMFKYQQERDSVADEWKQKEFDETKRVNDAQIAKMRSSGSGGSNPVAYTPKELEEASNSQMVKQFKASLMTEEEFKRRGKKTQISGKTVRFDTYAEYVETKIDEAYNNGKGSLTPREATALYQMAW